MKKTLLSALFAGMSAFSWAQTTPLFMRYPAISPDGQTIAFSYKGDIYTVSSKGGQATAITAHSGYECMPVWSHDGKKIAYASDKHGNFDVFVVDAKGGEPTRLTYHSSQDSPSDFTPDNKQVIFSASRMDVASNRLFPTGALSELYIVPIAGGRERQVLTTPAELARYNADGSMLVFQDVKGFEDDLRKHHTSSVTRDVWTYNTKTGQYTKLSTFEGEDRNPVFSQDGKSIFYLSEAGGSLNVYQTENGGAAKAVTQFKKHPVRHLSIADNGTLCFAYNGELYTQTGGEARKVDVQIIAAEHGNLERIVNVQGNVSEVAVSPNGKEVAFIVRGEVFVGALEGNFVKRITNTPEQERSVSFSPDGKAIIYASERNQSWNVYQTTLARKEESYFFNSTLLKEEAIIATEAEEFEPSYSPDGKEIAFLEERTTLRVYNIESKKTRTVLAGNRNYSYADGDQWYQWSPDSKWFLVNYLADGVWIREVGLLNADGKSEPINLTKSGYEDFIPRWAQDGQMVVWGSNRDGMKNQASWGGEADMYAMYFTQEAYDKALLGKEEFALLKEKEEKEKADKAAEKKDEKKEEKKDDKKEKKEEVKALTFELDGIDKRKRRLSVHSGNYGDAVLSKDGEKMYYLLSVEEGFDLWETNLRTKETKILAKLGANISSGLTWDSKMEKLYFIANGNINKIEVASGKRDMVMLQAELFIDAPKERAYMFEHIWRQVVKKFYVKDLHGVDWDFYKKEYARFLPHINNNYDFADMASELLGELNASHTGSGYRHMTPNGDATAVLGVFYDDTHKGNGLRIAEVIKGSPLEKKASKIKANTIIEKIDGVEITAEMNYYPLLNRKAGKLVLLSLYNESTKERWEETVKPINRGMENELLYERWVDNNRLMVEKLSGGKLGYVHVRGMDNESFKVVMEDVLGKCNTKEAVIVDTRFNGGGWLHDDLSTFLSGKSYTRLVPRGQEIGGDPEFKWKKPSAVLMGEGNYSDAHVFPYAYKTLGIGKLIGMPVPGTGTAVWWETLIDGSLYFGIPEVGVRAVDGKFLENTQLEPDVKVALEYEKVIKGQDQQIEKAVEVLLKDLKR